MSARTPLRNGHASPGKPSRASSGAGRWIGLAVGAAVLLVVAVVAVAMLNRPSAASPAATNGDGTAVVANGGHWTNVTADRLAAMLDHKDFTLLNVKTPYVGEISGTDLYIPYDRLVARSAELPPDRTAKIVVYCRSGNESAIAAQTLIDLGYRNIDNLDGGMTAWTASGRQLITVDRGSG